MVCRPLSSDLSPGHRPQSLLPDLDVALPDIEHPLSLGELGFAFSEEHGGLVSQTPPSRGLPRTFRGLLTEARARGWRPNDANHQVKGDVWEWS